MNGKIIKLFFGIAILGFSLGASAAQVECLISGTPTQQSFEPDFCQSTTNVPKPGVVFRFISDREVAHVTWSTSTAISGSWDCGSDNYCRFDDNGRDANRGLYDATACVTRVLYNDGTWENTNLCATGIYTKQLGF